MSVFDELAGQAGAREQLERAAAASRLDRADSSMTQAWLFTGPPGSGRVERRPSVGRLARMYGAGAWVRGMLGVPQRHGREPPGRGDCGNSGRHHHRGSDAFSRRWLVHGPRRWAVASNHRRGRGPHGRAYNERAAQSDRGTPHPQRSGFCARLRPRM